MRKLYIVLMVLLTVALSFGLVACGEDPETTPPEENQLLTMTGVTLESKTFTYDGTEKSLAVLGAPEGAKITYTNETQTKAGVYNVKAVITCEGYNDLTLNATLTIEKANFTGVTLESKTFTYDGTEKSLAVSGAPEGANITYTNATQTNAGVHNVQAVVTLECYNDLTLNATLTINKATIAGISAQQSQEVTLESEALNQEPANFYKTTK